MLFCSNPPIDLSLFPLPQHRTDQKPKNMEFTRAREFVAWSVYLEREEEWRLDLAFSMSDFAPYFVVMSELDAKYCT